MDATFSIELPRRAYTVAVVRDFLGEALRKQGICDECADDVLLAVSEACANAVEYGAPSHHYVVEADLRPDACVLWVSHNGRAPDRVVTERYDTDRVLLPSLEAESGRGIPLMKYLMDDVAYSGRPRPTVRLRKRLRNCGVSMLDGMASTAPLAYC